MFDNNDNDGDRGQVGIGTLIVFIAMVLVAAIAAGVLINTAGFLQSSAEQTGDESQAQVTERVDVTSSVGEVALEEYDGEDMTVSEDGVVTVNLTVTKSPGAGDIALEEMTIHWLGPDGADTLTYADEPQDGNFTLETVVGEDDNILSEQSDQFKVVINVSDTPVELTDDGDTHSVLGTGDDVTLRLTTASGAERVMDISVPDTLAVFDHGDAISLR